VSLVPVHGGLDAPVNRTLSLRKRKALLAEAAGMPSVVVNDADLATVYRIADGTLSPLVGPMTKAQWDLVLADQVIESRGERYAWTIPLALPVTDAEAAALKAGQQAALRNANGDVVGVLKVDGVYDWDKARYIERVYRTPRTDHPGGAMATNDPRTRLVGGDLWALPPKPHPAYGHQVLSPLQTRALIATRGWEKAVAFQTRNPLHRAHEYALVYGVEQLTRSGAFAGAVLNPLVGQLKGDDVDAPTRMKTYNALKTHALIGQGDTDPAVWDAAGYSISEVFDLIGLDIKMFYGGPSEAIMHGIYRQNHGFSHIIIGRKHADAPYFDKTAIWGDFDAHEIFDHPPGKIAIQAVKVGFAAYYASIGRVDLTENHPDEKPVNISGTAVRDLLTSGQRPPAEIMRGETADILIEAYRQS
jgi:sulfate adenylyltransferase